MRAFHVTVAVIAGKGERMITVTVDGYRAANQTLCIGDLKQALYDEGKVVMEGVLVTLHGEEHRTRRLLEMKIFRKDFFDHYEKTVLPTVIQHTLKRYRPLGRLDLMDFGRRAMLDLAADFAGIDRPLGTEEERDTLTRLLQQLGTAATLGQYAGDREAAREQLRRTLDEFDITFFTPSVVRREALLKQTCDGSLAEATVPRDILSVLLRNEDNLDLGRSQILRETAFYYLAGAHTSVHSLAHAMNEIFQWSSRHPEDAERLSADTLFVQRCVHESLRLHPSSPVALRRPLCPIRLPTGENIGAEDMVVVDLHGANRQAEQFGDDAGEFNPHRQLPPNQPPYGLTFGVGVHTCLGRTLAAGDVPRADVDLARHQYGTVTLLAAALLACRARPDPDTPAQRDGNTARESWTSYSVLLG